VRARVHAWNRRNRVTHTQNSSRIFEGRWDPPFEKRDRGGKKSIRVNTRNHGDLTGRFIHLCLRSWRIVVVRQTIQHKTRSDRVALLLYNLPLEAQAFFSGEYNSEYNILWKLLLFIAKSFIPKDNFSFHWDIKNFFNCTEKTVLLKYLKIWLATDLQIILLNHQNNYVER